MSRRLSAQQSESVEWQVKQLIERMQGVFEPAGLRQGLEIIRDTVDEALWALDDKEKA